MKKKKITARDYLKVVEWSDEDRCFIGSAPPLIGQCCHGDDEATVIRQLGPIVEEWIAIYEKDGRELPAPTAGQEYSGKFVLRIPPELHKSLSLRALSEGVSLNAYCAAQLGSVRNRKTEAPRKAGSTHKAGQKRKVPARPRGTRKDNLVR
jgi:predicted HicB family RNase H-like nuclease